MKNKNLSLLDANQMTARTFDEVHDAQRVVLVSGDLSESIVAAVKDGLKDMTVNVQSTSAPAILQPIPHPSEPIVITIPYQTVVKELEVVTVHVPTIVTEYKVLEIEKPIVITQTEVITVEKQIVVTQYKDIPKLYVYLFIAQLIISLLITILHK